MKKLIALTLVIVTCFSLFSCAKVTQWQLDKNAIALAAEKRELSSEIRQSDEYKAFIQKLEAFSARLTAEMTQKYGKDDNFVISPISIYMGLALAIECATGETRQEILDAVGVTYDEVSKYTSGLYANANKEYVKRVATGNKKVVAYQMLNNSIWLDKDVKFVEEGVNKLANDYNCDVFRASFQNGEAERLIEKYIENKTNGLIDADVEFSPETYFVLMNTYYLKEIWNEFGDSLDFTSERTAFRNQINSLVVSNEFITMFGLSNLDGYNNYIKMNKELKALHCLLEGVRVKFDVYMEAEELGVSQVTTVYQQILDILSSKYNVSEEAAMDIVSEPSDAVYTRKLEAILEGKTYSGETGTQMNQSDMLPEEEALFQN